MMGSLRDGGTEQSTKLRPDHFFDLIVSHQLQPDWAAVRRDDNRELKEGAAQPLVRNEFGGFDQNRRLRWQTEGIAIGQFLRFLNSRK